MGVEQMAIMAVFGMPVLIVYIATYFDSENKKAFHATLAKLIESGQELTPELLESVPGYKSKEKRKRGDIRSGSITSGVGIGIALFGHFGVQEQELFGIGLLVLCVGLGILAYGIYSSKRKRDDLS